jgi:hypothetical protein
MQRALRIVRAAAALLALVPAAAVVLAKDKDPSSAEAKLKPEAAKALAEYAAWCGANGAKTAGAAALDEATALDPAAPKLAETKAVLDGLAEDAADAGDAVKKQRKAVGPKIAAAYERLAAIDHEAKDAGRFESYLLGSVAWDPSPARLTKARRAIDDAASGNRLDAAGRLLVGVKRIDVEGVAAGKYDKLEVEFATKDALLLGSESHPLVGYVSLPKDWAKGKSYPVLVGVEGAGCGFLGYCRSFAGARGQRPVIVVAPITLSNTNAESLNPTTYPCYSSAVFAKWSGKALEFDGPGIDALLAVVRKRFGGEEKSFLTGFSGGGHYTYFKLFQDPAHVRGAAPACANFAGQGVTGAPGVADGGPPVHIFTGEKDQHRDHVFGQTPGVTGQNDLAQENLARLGYKRVERTDVKGAGHDSFPGLVWKFVDQVLASK